jgi:hypothetical protein
MYESSLYWCTWYYDCLRLSSIFGCSMWGSTWFGMLSTLPLERCNKPLEIRGMCSLSIISMIWRVNASMLGYSHTLASGWMRLQRHLTLLPPWLGHHLHLTWEALDREFWWSDWLLGLVWELRWVIRDLWSSHELVVVGLFMKVHLGHMWVLDEWWQANRELTHWMSM